MTGETSNEVAVLRNEVERLKEEVSEALKDIAEIKRVDALQTQKLNSIESNLLVVDHKLDTIVSFVQTTNGGKKALLGMLGIIGTVAGIAVAYAKLKP